MEVIVEVLKINFDIKLSHCQIQCSTRELYIDEAIVRITIPVHNHSP